MINRALFFTPLCLLLSSCVQPPVFKTEEHAVIISSYPIVAINGVEIEKAYQLDLKAGENSLLIVYNTYEYDYFCTFNWQAAGTKKMIYGRSGLILSTRWNAEKN